MKYNIFFYINVGRKKMDFFKVHGFSGPRSMNHSAIVINEKQKQQEHVKTV